MQKIVLICLATLASLQTMAQPENRWQQRVNYKMVINVDAPKNQFKGTQRLEYSNNSDQTLDRVFYHLYWNAFQPNSSMDVRSRELGKVAVNGRADWDARVRDRILKLKPDEVGYQKIISLKMNGVPQPFKYHETILEVNLTKAIAPKTKVVFEMEFEAQVPLQVRRSGRDNPSTGVRFSMSQWYPKMCEFDYEGWHPTPYVAREFYGVWGDYDVTINIDKEYKIGGTGVLTNAAEIGWGYDKAGTDLKSITSAKRTWKFVGKNIHDFVWAADPEYVHLVRNMPNGGPTLHVIYNYKPDNAKNDADWNTVADAAVTVLPFIEKNFGKYTYPQYSFIQGGDGGMEYPMATLINGPGLGTVFHEWMHTWYQMMLGTNESMYSWMDEGFTEFSSQLVDDHYTEKVRVDQMTKAGNTSGLKYYDSIGKVLPLHHAGSYASYFALAKSGIEEPMTTHADHYNTNFAYSIDAYSKGCTFINQLGYIVGSQTRDKILLEYYNRWRFKHPNANDFMKVAQDVSGIQLDWYKEYWINTTKKIDYGIDSLWEENGSTNIRLKRVGQLPMPIDVVLTKKDGTTETHSIPLNLMFGAKKEDEIGKFIVDEEWRWTHPTYIFNTKIGLRDMVKIEIDPTRRMADVDRKNNLLEITW
ncbi:M1 family metallopeptidase [Ferruginibacter yonginensis]|uniref:M1 family metallopeptidase n=1 Tax=Ferruginibacter yonginensis TaxID=1310416 RepID=A0ABV8QR92_9BACT